MINTSKFPQVILLWYLGPGTIQGPSLGHWELQQIGMQAVKWYGVQILYIYKILCESPGSYWDCKHCVLWLLCWCFICWSVSDAFYENVIAQDNTISGVVFLLPGLGSQAHHYHTLNRHGCLLYIWSLCQSSTVLCHRKHATLPNWLESLDSTPCHLPTVSSQHYQDPKLHLRKGMNDDLLYHSWARISIDICFLQLCWTQELVMILCWSICTITAKYFKLDNMYRTKLLLIT